MVHNREEATEIEGEERPIGEEGRQRDRERDSETERKLRERRREVR